MTTNRILATGLLAAGLLASSLRADGWFGYMNVFNNAGGTAGDYVFGSGWGLADLKTTITADVPGTIFGDQLRLEPNYNAYANSLNGSNEDRAFWTNSSNGGVTAGALGNKFMEANTIVESANIGVSSASFHGIIDGYTLASGYTAQAFIKVLNPGNGYSTDLFNTYDLANGSYFTINADLSAHQGKLLQMGFVVSGVNANPSGADLGSALVTVTATAIPEPSSFAAIFGGLSAAFAGLRRRRR